MSFVGELITTSIYNSCSKLFTVPYFSVRSSLRAAIFHERQNYLGGGALMARRAISRRSHEKIEDCKQSALVGPKQKCSKLFSSKMLVLRSYEVKF